MSLGFIGWDLSTLKLGTCWLPLFTKQHHPGTRRELKNWSLSLNVLFAFINVEPEATKLRDKISHRSQVFISSGMALLLSIKGKVLPCWRWLEERAFFLTYERMSMWIGDWVRDSGWSRLFCSHLHFCSRAMCWKEHQRWTWSVEGRAKIL